MVTDTKHIGVTCMCVYDMAWESLHHSVWDWSFGAEYGIYLVTYSIIAPSIICLKVAASVFAQPHGVFLSSRIYILYW